MYNNIRFFTFEQYHNKSNVGSTNIRVHQLIKYWPEAELYRYGQFPDVLIYQKVYCTADYKFPAHFENIQILDICDPDWLEGALIRETADSMDAIVTPTEPLANFIRQFHDKVIVIPDRFDMEVIPAPKVHKGDAKTVVWFGYSHNASVMKQAISLLDELKLNLICISNDDAFMHKWSSRTHEDFYKFIKYNEDTIYDDLQKADFALLPEGFRPVDIFKSNNKTIKANLAGLPVAKDADEVRKYMDAGQRRLWFNENYDLIKKEYDVRNSVKEYKALISEIKEIRGNANL